MTTDRELLEAAAKAAGLFIPRNGIPENGALMRFFKLAYEAGAAAEREACAQRAERWGQEVGVETWGMAGKDCATAIRARSKT